MPTNGLANAAYTPLTPEAHKALLRERWSLDNRRKVSIVGFCSTSRGYTPYNDPDMEVWGLNRGAIFMPRADRWFEMHGMHIATSQNRRPGDHISWLNAFQGPVYVHAPFDEIKNGVVYPLKEIADMLGPNIWRLGREVPGKPDQLDMTEPLRDTCGEPYVTSSIAYEIALAIWEGFEEIHLYGIDLNTDSEYAWQKPGVEFLIGFAAGRGQKVILPDNCPLLKGTLYGRGFMAERGERMSYQQLEVRMESLKKQAEALNKEIARVTGAAQECDHLISMMVPGINHEKMEQRRKQIQQALQSLQGQMAQAVGAINETAYWLHQTMDGQEPKEAILQINQSLHVADEGPLTDLDALHHPEYNPSPPELAAVGA